MMIRKNKSQSAIEYAALIAIAVGALIALSGYVKGAVAARLENARHDLNTSVK